MIEAKSDSASSTPKQSSSRKCLELCEKGWRHFTMHHFHRLLGETYPGPVWRSKNHQRPRGASCSFVSQKPRDLVTLCKSLKSSRDAACGKRWQLRCSHRCWWRL